MTTDVGYAICEQPCETGVPGRTAADSRSVRARCGPQRAELLKNLGICTARDLLFHIPTGINDFSDVRTVPKLEADVEQSVHGFVVDRDVRQLGGGRSLVGILIDCDGHYVRGLWFNQPWVFKKYRDNEHLVFSGKPQKKAGRWEFNGPRVAILAPDDDLEAAAGVLPRYPLTDGIKLDAMQRMTRSAVESYADLVTDSVPESFRTTHRLPDLPTALRWLHTPESVKQWQDGRYRILLDDLLEFQLGLAHATTNLESHAEGEADRSVCKNRRSHSTLV